MASRFVSGVERRTPGTAQDFKNAVHFQAEVVMQMRGAMLLHDEAVARFRCELGRWFWRSVEATLTLVLVQRHVVILATESRFDYARPDFFGHGCGQQASNRTPSQTGDLDDCRTG